MTVKSIIRPDFFWEKLFPDDLNEKNLPIVRHLEINEDEHSIKILLEDGIKIPSKIFSKLQPAIQKLFPDIKKISIHNASGEEIIPPAEIAQKKSIEKVCEDFIQEAKKKEVMLSVWLSLYRWDIQGKQARLLVRDQNALQILIKKNFLKNARDFIQKERPEFEINMDIGDFSKEIQSIQEAASAPHLPTNSDTAKKATPTSKTQLLMGKRLPLSLPKVSDLQRKQGTASCEGKIIQLEQRTLRGGKTLLEFYISDSVEALCCKKFFSRRSAEVPKLEKGMYVGARGKLEEDDYSGGDFILSLQDLEKREENIREEKHKGEQRIEFHLHSKFSEMDSVVEIPRLIQRLKNWGHKAIAITDHNCVYGFPGFDKLTRQNGLTPIFGTELRVFQDQNTVLLSGDENTPWNQSFVAFDLETTGLGGWRHHIIEIGAVKVIEGRLIDRFQFLINPPIDLPEISTQITGIKPSDLDGAPPLPQVLPRFLEFIEDLPLIAHNANFDFGFIKTALNRLNAEPLKNPVLDSIPICAALLPNLKQYSLAKVAKHLSIAMGEHHRAVDDANTLGNFINAMREQFKEKEIRSIADLNNLPVPHRANFAKEVMVLAKNRAGLEQLYRIISAAHTEFFYRTPRIPWSLLEKSRENLLLGCPCREGELLEGILQGDSPEDLKKIAQKYDYLEIVPPKTLQGFVRQQNVLIEDDLLEIIKTIEKTGKETETLVLATGNVHYLDPEEETARTVAARTGMRKGPSDSLYLRSTHEMLEDFAFLGEEKAKELVIKNTNLLSKKMEDFHPVPDGFFPPQIKGAEESLKKISQSQMETLYGKTPPEGLIKRAKAETDAILNNGYAVLYETAREMVKRVEEKGYVVGSRGSVGSSFIAFLSGITEVNPLPPHYRCFQCKKVYFEEGPFCGLDLPKKNCPDCGIDMSREGFRIPFAVFMGFDGNKVPDIDLNFAPECQEGAMNHVEEMFGTENVFRAGTLNTLKEQNAFGFVKKYFDEEKGISPGRSLTLPLVKSLLEVRRTTGQHPGGIIVVPKGHSIFEFTPIQYPANKQDSIRKTTHLDYHSIDEQLVKLDILGHEAPSQIHALKELTGIDPMSIPLDDPDTLSIFSSIQSLGIPKGKLGTTVGTLGVPEFGTEFVQGMLEDIRPKKFGDLIRISGLSHGTDVWLNNAQALIRSGKAKFPEVISTRGDIMTQLIDKGMEPIKAFEIMEKVRKGKGVSDEARRLMKQNHVPDWYIESCNAIKYLFPKAHAVAYVLMAVRIAWFKVHHPLAFYAAYFSSKGGQFDAMLIGHGEKKVNERRKEILMKGNSASTLEKNILVVLNIAQEIWARNLKISKVDLYHSDPNKFTVRENALVPPLTAIPGLGINVAIGVAKERKKEKEFSSIEDLANRTRLNKTVIKLLKEHGTLDGMPDSDQMSLF